MPVLLLFFLSLRLKIALKKGSRDTVEFLSVTAFGSNFLCPADLISSDTRQLVTAAYHFPSSTGCSSPPGQEEGPRACVDVHVATAAPWLASGALLTAHALPEAGALPTCGEADLLAGHGQGTVSQIRDVAASRARGVAGPAGGWGWLRAGRGSAPGVVQRRAGQQAGGPQNLGDTQDIHHHLRRVSIK